jgi:anthranilate phosphoribosyltransferase
MAALAYLRQIVEGRETLTRPDASALMHHVLAGDLVDTQLAALLGALAARGETAAELAGFVDAMRAAATSIPLSDAERLRLVDTCGTGGDASGTFNISTAAALVAAAATASTGTMVAKHGNRAVTSQCGSADVLEALGIPVTLAPESAAAALRTHRFAFLHAPHLHPALKTVMPVRRALGIRTVFNILGPLANPAGARAQVMGVYAARLVPLVAEAMRLLGVRHAFVVHGASGSNSTATSPAARNSGGMDELSISGPSQIAEVRGDTVTFATLTPEEVGLPSAPIDLLRGGDAAANAESLRRIFAGETGPRRDVVLLNTAAVLIAAGAVPSPPAGLHAAFKEAIQLAASTIDSGAVTKLIANLAVA